MGGIGGLNPIRYRGYYWDEEIALYYLNARYYDPEVGRFISQDSIKYIAPETLNGINLFVYCLNNPVMETDPDGNLLLTLGIMALVGAIISATSSIVTQAITNNGDINWGVVAVEAIAGGISGALSIAPIGFIGQGFINGAISMTTYLIDCSIQGNEATDFGIISSFLIGGFSGMLGGDGMLKEITESCLKQMEKQLIKNIFKDGVKNIVKNIYKQASTYLGKIYVTAVKESIQISIISVATTLLSDFSEKLIEVFE